MLDNLLTQDHIKKLIVKRRSIQRFWDDGALVPGHGGNEARGAGNYDLHSELMTLPPEITIGMTK